MFIQQEKQEHNQYQKLTKESINIKLMKKQTSKSNTVDKVNLKSLSLIRLIYLHL